MLLLLLIFSDTKEIQSRRGSAFKHGDFCVAWKGLKDVPFPDFAIIVLFFQRKRCNIYLSVSFYKIKLYLKQLLENTEMELIQKQITTIEQW
jgi:hypothetical protein